MATAKKAWIIAADMGYGHGRAAFPLRHLSPTGTVINANNYQSIPKEDYNYWKNTRDWYERISRFRDVPLLGSFIFGIMDEFQKIKTFKPGEKDFSPTLQLKQTYKAIRNGLGKQLIEELNKNPLPLVTTFFSAAYMAEEHRYKGDIFLITCDSDVSRSWAPLNAPKSRIHFCASSEHVARRLETYGVKSSHIHLTGFPLPVENIGSRKEVVKRDLGNRLHKLDPFNLQTEVYKEFAGKNNDDRPLTITFAVGGAGAQKEIANTIMKSLESFLRKGTIHLNIVAGVRAEVRDYFLKCVKANGLTEVLGKNITIYFFETKETYFGGFNEIMRTTDILWTKPSELVFFAALGIPIIMSPALGSQEDANQAWLQSSGAGIMECAPERAHEWLIEWIETGILAKTAMNGYSQGMLDSVKNITKLLD